MAQEATGLTLAGRLGANSRTILLVSSGTRTKRRWLKSSQSYRIAQWAVGRTHLVVGRPRADLWDNRPCSLVSVLVYPQFEFGLGRQTDMAGYFLPIFEHNQARDRYCVVPACDFFSLVPVQGTEFDLPGVFHG